MGVPLFGQAHVDIARARVATAEEKPDLWLIMTATGAPYDEFQAKADREIPMVVLEPGSGRAAVQLHHANALGAGQAVRLDGPGPLRKRFGIRSDGARGG